MKILTAAEMREADARTIDAGLPALLLMENAAHRFMECLEAARPQLRADRIAVLCGQGNNGGDGLAIARLLWILHRPAALDVFLTEPVDARALTAVGVEPRLELDRAKLQRATLVIDALLGTGIRGEPRERAAEWIAALRQDAAHAFVASVDLPSGMNSDSGDQPWPVVRADLTVTFTAPKRAHALPPNCDRHGELHIRPIGTSDAILAAYRHHWLTPADFAACLEPRARASHKGSHGHVLVVGGREGKTGAAHLAGIAALRAGAGLVTVASASNQGFPPELMWEPLPASLERKTVLAIGPGLGLDPTVPPLYRECPLPAVADADALNSLAPLQMDGAKPAAFRVLTPHPGEMRRLDPSFDFGQPLEAAAAFAIRHQAVLVLKGQRTVIAFPGGRVYVNPTGSPALAKGGSGDVLTGFMAALLAQHPQDPEQAVLAAVWLHGRAGEHAGREWGERSALASDTVHHFGKAYADAQRDLHHG